jgi:hypothetical protein
MIIPKIICEKCNKPPTKQKTKLVIKKGKTVYVLDAECHGQTFHVEVPYKDMQKAGKKAETYTISLVQE